MSARQGPVRLKRAAKNPKLGKAPKPAKAANPVERDEPHREDRQFVTALARGLEILSCFSAARPEIGGTEIAAMTGLPQPTVWRLCHTMVQLGYLVPVRGDKLRPGIPVRRLGAAALTADRIGLASHARLQDFADRYGSATGIAAQDEGRMVFVQSCLSEAQLVMNLRVGSRLSLATSAVGWGLLAGFTDQEREAVIQRFAASDPRWIQVEPAFREALADYERTGFILNIGAFKQAYNTIAIPVMGRDGRPAYSLSCAGSAITHTAAFLADEIAPSLLALARELESEI